MDPSSLRPVYLNEENAAAFSDVHVASIYHHRPPYPASLFPLLSSLVVDTPRRVLDLGCGSGNIARRLAPLVDSILALDPSAEMLAAGRSLPDGDHPKIEWRHGRAEDAPIDGAFSLVVAGDSMHWMEWPVVLPRCRDLLSPSGMLAIVESITLPSPWTDELRRIIARYSVIRDYERFDMIERLTRAGLFDVHDRTKLPPETFTQSIDEYIESFHARSGLGRTRMGEENAAAFDEEVRKLVRGFADGIVTLETTADVAWGRPLGRGPSTDDVDW